MGDIVTTALSDCKGSLFAFAVDLADPTVTAVPAG